MRHIWIKRTSWALVFGLATAGIVWFAWPQPIPVDIAVVAKDAMEVTVDDEAKTSVREIYTVSAPVSGTVLRTLREVGDPVTADETIVAVMQPVTPDFHDASTHAELLAAVAAAEAAEKFAEAELRRIAAALDFSRKELQRAQALAPTDTLSVRTLEDRKS